MSTHLNSAKTIYLASLFLLIAAVLVAALGNRNQPIPTPDRTGFAQTVSPVTQPTTNSQPAYLTLTKSPANPSLYDLTLDTQGRKIGAFQIYLTAAPGTTGTSFAVKMVSPNFKAILSQASPTKNKNTQISFAGYAVNGAASSGTEPLATINLSSGSASFQFDRSLTKIVALDNDETLPVNYLIKE